VHIKSFGRCVSTSGSTFEIFWPNQQFKLTVASWVQFTLRVVVFVFTIQFLVPITMILINLVIGMNLFRWVHYESYQRRSLTAVR
jgi:hypothetical protein